MSTSCPVVMVTLASIGCFLARRVHAHPQEGLLNSLLGVLGQPASRSSNAEAVGALQDDMERVREALSEVLRNQRSAPHFIFRDASSRGGWLVLALPAAAGIVYVSLWLLGWTSKDIMYATRGSLTTVRSSMEDGFRRLWVAANQQRDELHFSLAAVEQKQDVCIQNQARLDLKVDNLCAHVTLLTASIDRLSERLVQLDGHLLAVAADVHTLEEGIMHLLRVMVDMTQAYNFQGGSLDALRRHVEARTPVRQGAVEGATVGSGGSAHVPALRRELMLSDLPAPAATDGAAARLALHSFGQPLQPGAPSLASATASQSSSVRLDGRRSSPPAPSGSSSSSSLVSSAQAHPSFPRPPLSLDSSAQQAPGHLLRAVTTAAGVEPGQARAAASTVLPPRCGGLEVLAVPAASGDVRRAPCIWNLYSRGRRGQQL